MTEFTVAIIGRPNVGKSTLFNRLVGKKHAIVDDFPGVTRDWREGTAKIGPLSFKIIDTAGLEEDAKDELGKKIKQVTINAIEHANLVLFVTDSKVGITSEDSIFAKWLHRKTVKTFLIANKSENTSSAMFLQDYYRLGMGEPVFISAEHGLGMVDLFDAINEEFEKFSKEYEETKPSSNDAISVAIVGRPNAGKSTLVNQLLKEERMVTGDMPGITRDSIALDYVHNGQSIKLIDTAGIKKKVSIKDKLEEMTYEDSKRAIKFAHVVVLLIDATIAFEKQDIAIANMVIAEGRPLVIAINKWDKISEKSKYNNALVDSISELLPEVKDVPLIYISAINGHNIHLMMNAAIEAYENWNIRIPTRKLNEWLSEKLSAHPIPLGANSKRVKIKYMTQHNIRPPAFVLFSNLPDEIDDSYIRYLKNSLKDIFGLKGVPIRMHAKKTGNPYSDCSRS
ncbi:MAG: ribosome biogenesis GTPase Der [Pseudomonadota bacterium]